MFGLTNEQLQIDLKAPCNAISQKVMKRMHGESPYHWLHWHLKEKEEGIRQTLFHGLQSWEIVYKVKILSKRL